MLLVFNKEDEHTQQHQFELRKSRVSTTGACGASGSHAGIYSKVFGGICLAHCLSSSFAVGRGCSRGRDEVVVWSLFLELRVTMS